MIKELQNEVLETREVFIISFKQRFLLNMFLC